MHFLSTQSLLPSLQWFPIFCTPQFMKGSGWAPFESLGPCHQYVFLRITPGLSVDCQKQLPRDLLAPKACAFPAGWPRPKRDPSTQVGTLAGWYNETTCILRVSVVTGGGNMSPMSCIPLSVNAVPWLLLQSQLDGYRSSDWCPFIYIYPISLLSKPAASQLIKPSQLRSVICSNPHKGHHWIQSKSRGPYKHLRDLHGSACDFWPYFRHLCLWPALLQPQRSLCFCLGALALVVPEG